MGKGWFLREKLGSYTLDCQFLQKKRISNSFEPALHSCGTPGRWNAKMNFIYPSENPAQSQVAASDASQSNRYEFCKKSLPTRRALVKFRKKNPPVCIRVRTPEPLACRRRHRWNICFSTRRVDDIGGDETTTHARRTMSDWTASLSAEDIAAANKLCQHVKSAAYKRVMKDLESNIIVSTAPTGDLTFAHVHTCSTSARRWTTAPPTSTTRA